MDEKRIRMVAEEAARLKKDNPRLGYKEAIDMAKEMLGYSGKESNQVCIEGK